MSTVTYFYPNGPKAPTQAQMEKSNAVHATVSFADEDVPVDIVHNFLFNTEDSPLGPSEVPLVVVNAISGGANPALHSIAYKDGNTITIGKVGTGPGSGVVYDVWIIRHMALLQHKGIFGR